MKDRLSHSAEKESIPDVQWFFEEDVRIGCKTFYRQIENGFIQNGNAMRRHDRNDLLMQNLQLLKRFLAQQIPVILVGADGLAGFFVPKERGRRIRTRMCRLRSANNWTR